MKRLVIFSASVVALLAAGLLTSTALAQQSTTLSDAHVARIQQNCSAALRTIQQLHTNDALMRVNRGQVYDSISTKLMSRLNSRIVLNKLDAAPLVRISAQYDQQLSLFVSNYIRYDNQVSRVLRIDCRKDPVLFYQEVAKARELRGQVHGNVDSLTRLIDEYEKAFSTFRTGFLKSPSEEQAR